MLIAAIPKSASTSMMATLGALHGLRSEQIELRDLASATGINHLHQHHPDIVELDQLTTDRLADPSMIYKQHIPPTDNNLRLLSDHRVVVLLRRPDEVLDAYHRAFRSYSMHVVGVDRRISRTEWRNHAEEVGLADDIRFFHDRWRAVADDGFLVIDFDDLIAQPTKVINDVERHLGLPPTSGPIELRKERYTRNPLFTVERRVGQVARRLGVYERLDGMTKRFRLR